MHEFIEHFTIDDNFITDIWYDKSTSQYRSVVSDLEPITFSKLEEIKLYLTGTVREEKE